MDKGEPTLVPEWLKNAGSLSGSGTISHSDDHSTSKLARNKSFVNSNGHDFGRFSGSDRTTSSYFRQSSSNNGSAHLRSYNSFGRNVRDREWEKDTYDSRDKDKSVLGDRRHRDFSDSPGNTSSSKFERDGLRRSQSAISAKHGDTWTKKAVSDSSSAGGNNNNVLLTKGVSMGGVNKANFERNFPSLGAEERASVPEIGRIPSPGLSSSIQSLPVGTSATIGSEKWTSALAEVPVLAGSNGIGISSMQQAASAPLALGITTSLNMAEAVAQGPNRAPIAPQLSVGTQRLEELAIKQSRQLIPVTPTMPKTSVLNSSDKQKTKVSQQQHPISSLPINHSPRGGPGKGDISKASNVGKLHVLKPVREKNGVAPMVKDNVSPTNGSRVVSSMLAAAPSVSGSAAARAPNNPVPDRKPVMTVLEKRTTSHAQSRNEFFNLVRKKSLANSSPVADLDVENSSSIMTDKLSEKKGELASNNTHTQLSASLSGDLLSEKTDDLTCIDNTSDAHKYFSNEKNRPCFDPAFSEEEEAAFLHSLGWEENSDEGGLTEEEISAFFKDITKYVNSKPALKGVQPKFLLPFNSQIGGFSSGLNSSDAKLES